MFKALGEVSYYRGGYASHGSCIWADIREHFDKEGRLDVFQVVGHTMLSQIIGDTTLSSKVNIIKDKHHIACIDTQKIWNLKEIFDYK